MTILQEIENIATMLPQYEEHWPEKTAKDIVELAHRINVPSQKLFQEITNTATMLPGTMGNDRKWAWEQAIDIAKLQHRVDDDRKP